MKSLIVFPASVALVLSIAACERTTAPAEGNMATTAEAATADLDAVKKADAAFNAAIAAKDLATVTGYYASDAVMIIPGQPPFNGIDAITADYKTFFADPSGKYVWTADSAVVSSGGDLAYTQSTYQVTNTNPETKTAEEANRYNILVYRKQPDGNWKIIRDINTDVPKAG